MARQPVNLGTPPLGQDGDTFRTAAQKWEANFTELYAMAGGAAARILIPADGTLVDKLTPGIYYVLSGAAGAPIAGLGGFLDIANTPDAVGGQVKTEQRFREYDGPRQWRRVYNAGGSSWTPWAKDRDFSLETIGSGVNLNTILTPGDYFVTPGATNVPAGVTGRARLEVPAILDPGAQEVEQLLYPAATPGILYRRVYTVSSSTWGAWATIGAAPANTDAIPEGSANLYFTQARVRATPLTGIAASTAAITASDSVLSALGKAMGSFVNALPRPTNTDAVTLFADTAAVSGWYDKLMGGPVGSRQTDHPDGTTAAGTYDEVNYYWVLNITYAGNVFQAAFPYVSAAGNGRERIKFRLKGGTTWTAWQPLTAGTLTRSTTDVTAGRILKAGDGGLMGELPVIAGTNLDDKTIRGWRYWSSVFGHTGTPPAGTVAGMVITNGVTANFVFQEFTELIYDSTSARKWRRNSYGSGAWSPWQQEPVYASLPFVNLMPDSGRFGGRINPLQVNVTTFTPSVFLAAYNGGSHASGGQFIGDNSTNGGAGAALTEPVQSLLTAMGRTGNGARYGIEFFVDTYTFGSGTANAAVGTDSVTRYLATTNGTRAIFQAQQYATLVMWIRARTSSFHFQFDCFVNGVSRPANTPITVAEGWVHVRMANQSGVGYSNSFPNLCGVPGSSVNIACMGIFGGFVDVGFHTSPLGTINELSA